MNMKEISKKKLAKIKAETLLIINDIRKDYEMLCEYTSKPKEKGTLSKFMEDAELELIDTNEALIKMVEKRKDKKYASLTAELASVMEDFLQELFKACNTEGKKFDTQNKGPKESTIKAIESKLKNYIDIENEGDLKLLNVLRNKAVHENAFSLKKAKKEESVQKILIKRNLQEKKKSKEILLQLIIDSEKYVKNTKVKSDIN